MHIALVNQWYPPETGGGGVATHNAYFAHACVVLGHRVTVIANRRSPAIPALSEQNGVTVIRVPSIDLYRLRRLPVVGRQYRFAQAMQYSRAVCRALADLHRREPVDVAEFAEVNAEGYFWQSDMSRRMAVRCHTPSWVLSRYYSRADQPFDTSLLGWAEKRTLRKAHVLTTPSQDMAEVISADTGIAQQCIHPIPNALDVQQFSPAPQPPPPEPINILWVGRVERAKGADVLIEAIPEVCKQAAHVRFVVVGGARPHPLGGNYHDYMRARLAPFIEAGQVQIRGFVPDDALQSIYHESHISVVPSLLYESFSFTVAQSMACGLPVITTRIGGVPETVNQGQAGILVPPGNVPALVAAILDLVRDPARRQALGESARHYAVKHFAADAVSARILELYQQAFDQT